ncbi:Olfactory Receptor 14L1-Like [Manis pentadactyla]|nr:Olfactory Receptor 14L1-Like [Manis pentadactyla]
MTLQNPMYIFLGNLYFLEIWYTTLTVPKLLATCLSRGVTISVSGCIAQYYFFFLMGATECILLAVMAYDQYLAICNPLRYTLLMSIPVCLQFSTGSWIGGLIFPLLSTILISHLNFYGPQKINHFFCDSDPIYKLSCSDTFLLEALSYTCSSVVILSSFLLTMSSYGHIVVTDTSSRLTGMDNLTTITEFLLMDISSSHELQVLQGFGAAEFAILTVMSYERYVAICHLLHYETIMNKGACGRMVVASYVSALLYGAMHVSVTFSTNFSSNKIHHFFCDIPQIILISNPEMNIDETSVTLIAAMMTIMCFTSIIYSYVNIFSDLLKISSKEGRSKTLSTCIPHLVVVALFTFTADLAYLKPPSPSQTILDLLLSVSYTVLSPIMNPIIYSLRNNDMKATLDRVLIKEVQKIF